MAEDVNAAIESHRTRLREQAAALAKLERAARELETPEPADPQVAKALQRARADLERAEAALKARKRDYARFRLLEALGPDPEHVEADLFDDAALALTSGRLTRHEARGPRDGPIGFDVFRALLLSDLSLAPLIENEAAERKATLTFDPGQEQTSTKNILRRWAATLEADPYVANILRCARDAAGRFAECLEQFTRTLEAVRINYELKQGKVDRLAFALLGRRAVVEACNDWDNVERACPDEARRLVERFHGLREARDEQKRLYTELNGEVRAFMSCFFPRYVTYVLSQGKARQQGLGRFHARRLCQYALEQIERTDFLLPRGGKLEIEVPRIPPEIALFRKTKSYLRHKRERAREALAPEAAPAPEDDAQ